MVPLIIVAFNRPDKLRQIVAAVRQQTVKPDLVIGVIDGSRSSTDEPLVRACRRDMMLVADEIIERPNNFGCAANIMLATNDIVNRFDRFVLLEDDTLPAATWYEAMCLLLNRYEHDPQVGAVGSFPSILNGSLDDHPDVIMSPRFSCWGWGSWRFKWTRVCADWLHYKQHGQPPWDTSKLPGHAGPDIVPLIQTYQPGQLWDGLVAGSFLHHGLLQAITRYYLVHNIGAEIHVSDSKIRFMWSNNPIQERVPTTFPPRSTLDMRVSQAVINYVRMMST